MQDHGEVDVAAADRNRRGFSKVDTQARGFAEVVEYVKERVDLRPCGVDEDHCVVRVQTCAHARSHPRQRRELPSTGRRLQQTMQRVDAENEQQRRKGAVNLAGD